LWLNKGKDDYEKVQFFIIAGSTGFCIADAEFICFAEV